MASLLGEGRPPRSHSLHNPIVVTLALSSTFPSASVVCPLRAEIPFAWLKLRTRPAAQWITRASLSIFARPTPILPSGLRQKQLIARLADHGQTSAPLQIMQDALALMEEHRRLIAAELARK